MFHLADSVLDVRWLLTTKWEKYPHPGHSRWVELVSQATPQSRGKGGLTEEVGSAVTSHELHTLRLGVWYGRNVNNTYACSPALPLEKEG